jgi:hypothetical protein
LLSIIYSKCYEKEKIPKSWKKGKTILLPKENSAESLKNWRPITLLNTIYKGYSTIISDYIKENLIKNNTIPEEQCRFLPEKDTTIAAMTYIKLLKICNLMKYSLHVIYIDLEKAYNSLQH